MATSQEYTISRKVSDTEEEIIQIPYDALANKPDLSVYQTKNDASLETNDKTVVGAINEVVTGVAETLESFGMSLAPQENGKLNKKVYVYPDGYFSQGTSYDASKDLYLSIGDGLALETIDEANNIWNIKSGSAITSVDGLGGGAISGNVSTSGSLTVGGSLTVNGTTTTVDSTTLQVKDKLIEVAHGNTTALTTPAGLVAPKYDGTNSGALVFDSTGTAYVGDVKLDSTGNIDVPKSGLQPLATRTGLVGGNLVQYDSSALTLKDSGKKISDLALKTDIPTDFDKLHRIKKQGYAGNNNAVKYFKLATFPVYNSNGNYASFIITGRMGGWESGNMSFVNMILYNRGSEGGAYINVANSSFFNLCDIVIYREADGTSTAYIKVKGYYTFDINVNTYQAVNVYTGTDVPPTGTLKWTASTQADRLAVSGGVAYVNGFTLPKQVQINGTTVNPNSAGLINLGTVLTDESKFATSAQGTKADNAMPKSGGTFTGNISLLKELVFTDNTNPFIKMTTGGTDFYFQSTSGQFGLGPTWNKATHWDSNGNVTFPTVPKVGNSSLALKSDISGKQDKLTAGSNITISGNTISATVPTKTSQLTNDSNFVKSNSGAFTGNLTADNFNSRFSLQSVPYGTAVGENADLNTATYLSVGNYYCGANAIVSTMTNVPVKRAFMMTVYSPLTPTVDNETTGKWVYRVRKFMTYLGEEYIQSVYSGNTAGAFTYGAWQQIAHKSDIPTMTFDGTTLTINI